jgi:hypothetical protein
MPNSGAVSAVSTKVRVEAKAGFLKITGEEGLTEVQAHGEACAKNRRSLEKVQLRGERSGEEVRIVVDIPEGWSNGGVLDLEVRVPAGLAVDIQDGSGEVEVDGVASLRLQDGSGGRGRPPGCGPASFEVKQGPRRVPAAAASTALGS